jgi:hypothetical protein
MKNDKKITLTKRQRALLESDLERVVGGATASGADVNVPDVNETIDAVGAAL